MVIMKRTLSRLFLGLFLSLSACTTSVKLPSQAFVSSLSQSTSSKVSTETTGDGTKIFVMTTEAETQPGGYSNDAKGTAAVLTETALPTPTIATIEYQNSEYGFSFTLPATWKGYSILTDSWQGYLNSQNNVIVTQGPIISIRNPQWTSTIPRQDIPIWVFTIAQWNSFQQGDYSISAGGIYSELGRNANYVFALYSRYNYTLLPGFEEVQTILESNPLHTS